MICLRSGVELVSIDALLDLDILLDWYETFLHAFLWSELQDLLVAVCSLALDILPSWFESELPWSFYSCLVLQAVITCSVVSSNYLEVCLRVVLLKSRESNRFLEAEEELYV